MANLSSQPRALERWLPISFPSVALSLLLAPSILNPAFFPSVSQLKVKGGARSSVRPSTSNRLITSSKRCVYHVNRGPKGPGRTKHPFVREGPQTDKRVGGFSGRWGRRKQIAAQSVQSVRSGKSLSSVDVKLQCTPMSSEVKGNAPDRPWVSYDSQIQKCRVKLGDVDEGLSRAGHSMCV